MKPWARKQLTTHRAKARAARPQRASGMNRTVRFTVYGKPVGAPRMTQCDKWKQRPCVMRYRAWKDSVREAALGIPSVDQIQSLSWTAYFEPPQSWSVKKKQAAMDSLHRSKPDRDNIDKAILDALFEQDSGIACGRIEKRWGSPERVEVEIIMLDVGGEKENNSGCRCVTTDILTTANL